MSEHASQEFTQIVTLVALLRQHFQRRQDSHTHRGFTTRSGLEDSSAKLKLPALLRAKNTLASSIDNVRSRQRSGSQSTRMISRGNTSAGSQTAAAASDGRVTQSLNLPVRSPIFARKTKLDTLMAPISMSPSPSYEKEKKLGSEQSTGEKRERSWSESVNKRKAREPASEDGSPSSPGKERERLKDKRDRGRRRTPPSPPVTTKTGKEPSTPQRQTRAVSPLASPPATSQKLFDTFQTPRRTPTLGLSTKKAKRASRTPPAQMVSTPIDYPPGVRKGHRRSTSYTCRAEIFESIHTPERRSSHDLCEFMIA